MGSIIDPILKVTVYGSAFLKSCFQHAAEAVSEAGSSDWEKRFEFVEDIAYRVRSLYGFGVSVRDIETHREIIRQLIDSKEHLSFNQALPLLAECSGLASNIFDFLSALCWISKPKPHPILLHYFPSLSLPVKPTGWSARVDSIRERFERWSNRFWAISELLFLLTVLRMIREEEHNLSTNSSAGVYNRKSTLSAASSKARARIVLLKIRAIKHFFDFITAFCGSFLLDYNDDYDWLESSSGISAVGATLAESYEGRRRAQFRKNNILVEDDDY